jgi:hypothetical protein
MRPSDRKEKIQDSFLQEKSRICLMTKVGNRHFFEGCEDEMQMHEKTKILRAMYRIPDSCILYFRYLVNITNYKYHS